MYYPTGEIQKPIAAKDMLTALLITKALAQGVKAKAQTPQDAFDVDQFFDNLVIKKN